MEPAILAMRASTGYVGSLAAVRITGRCYGTPQAASEETELQCKAPYLGLGSVASCYSVFESSQVLCPEGSNVIRGELDQIIESEQELPEYLSILRRRRQPSELIPSLHIGVDEALPFDGLVGTGWVCDSPRDATRATMRIVSWHLCSEVDIDRVTH